MNLTIIRTIQLGVKSLLLQKMRAGLAALGMYNFNRLPIDADPERGRGTR